MEAISENNTKYGYCFCGCGNKTKIIKETQARDGHIKGEPYKYLHGHNAIKGKSYPIFNGKKICNNCFKARQLYEFSVSNTHNDGLSAQCNLCIGKPRKAGSTIHHLKVTYGISIDEYVDLLIKQNGVCAICNVDECTRKLAVDHCHLTGKIRGLLCFKCNGALGKFKDSKEILLSAVDYLESTGEDTGK